MELEIEKVKVWIEKIVIKLNFCPFANIPFTKDKILYVVHRNEDLQLLFRQFYAVLRELQEEPSDQLETAFVIYPDSFLDFQEYLDYIELLNEFLLKHNLENEFQLASFHPNYQFEGTEPEDVTNNTNKSPFPLVHILRSESVFWARKNFGDTHQIPKNNINLLNSMQKEGWQKFCKEQQISLH